MLLHSFKLFISVLILISFFACKNNSTDETNQQNPDKAGNIEKEEKEVNNKQQENKFKTIHNSRFDFSIDIPEDWAAEELSSNNDGFFITADDPNIDIRAYGSYLMNTEGEFYEQTFEEYGNVYDFEFSDGTYGLKAILKNSLFYFRIEKEVVKHFYVDGSKSWIDNNIELLDQIASTMK